MERKSLCSKKDGGGNEALFICVREAEADDEICSKNRWKVHFAKKTLGLGAVFPIFITEIIRKIAERLRVWYI